MWKKVALGVSAVALIGGAVLVSRFLSDDPLPTRDPVSLVHADQGWTAQQRDFYYYTSQGTVIMPLSWFKAMRRAGGGKLNEREWLAGLGFLTDGVEPTEKNPDALPVGFATFTFEGFTPGSRPEVMVGFTCAACHTGQLNYQGKGFRVDGAPALADVNGFSTALGMAILTTRYLPWRWSAFEKEVLGPLAGNEQARQALKAGFEPFAQGALAGVKGAILGPNLYPTREGFGRLDALGRIGNTVFADDLHFPANNRVADAPVNFPHLWDIWKFDWVQYNGSVRQPMVRNVGEALGVRALTNFIDKATGQPNPEPARWDTSIPVTAVHALEQTLADLQAPRWPEEIFGAIDPAKAEAGRALFAQHCLSCHGIRPIIDSPQGEEWAVTMIPLKRIGTEPRAAVNFAAHRLDGSLLGAGELTPGEGLKLVTEMVKGRAYDALGLTPEQRADYDGFGRPNEVRAPCAYKARPLDGVWATPPFLHNGAVPTIWHLLSPQEERPDSFWKGSFDYDPRLLGYRTDKLPGGLEFTTTAKGKPVAGNSNAGHLFTDDMAAPGRIGPKLDEAARWAILEYLKTMPDAELPTLPPVRAYGPDRDWADTYPCQDDPDWYESYAGK